MKPTATSLPSGASSRTLPPKSAATLALAGRSATLVPDRLCLLCASTVLRPASPAAAAATSTSSQRINSADGAVETTCCRRPICGPCCKAKGRAARWDPCLLCAAGHPPPRSSSGTTTATTDDGSGQFVLGDSDDDDDDDTDEHDATDGAPAEGAMQATDAARAELPVEPPAAAAAAAEGDVGALTADGRPVRHIVRKGETLIGIALKYGADVRPTFHFLPSRL